MISSTSRLGARAGMFSLVALLCLSVACDDTSNDTGETGTGTETTGDGDSGDGDGDGGLSYAADIQPIWDANCIVCHMLGGEAELWLDLSGDSYGNIVGTLSLQATDKQLIEAGNAADSYLIAKLRNTQLAAGGSDEQMPNGAAEPLPEATIVMIEQWVNEGALP